MDKLRAEFGPRIQSRINSQNNNASILSSVNLETNLLELFYHGLLVPNQAERTLEVFDRKTLMLEIRENDTIMNSWLLAT